MNANKNPVEAARRITAQRVILCGEAARYETLAARAALLAVTGNPGERERNEQLARDHLLRAETYKDAARQIERTRA